MSRIYAVVTAWGWARQMRPGPRQGHSWTPGSITMKKFKEWFHRTRLVVVAEPRTKRTEINPAKIIEIRIVEI